MTLNSIPELIADLQQGKMIILMDAEDRENEGDLIMAAEFVRPEDINFMIRFGRGLVCIPMTEPICRQLELPLMVSAEQNAYVNPYGTNFTVSVEAASGVSTGISAADRARTARAAAASHAKPSDLVRPGHMFPLMARVGGVLTRPGHTEASCDLMTLAGLRPVAVLVEILNEDGSMARRADLEGLAAQHQLKMGTIADLIQYRLQREPAKIQSNYTA